MRKLVAAIMLSGFIVSMAACTDTEGGPTMEELAEIGEVLGTLLDDETLGPLLEEN